jgi:hypothetical protein
MHSTQTTLIASNTDDPDTEATNDDPPTTHERCTTATESASQTILAAPDQRGGHDCCPWCLAAAETFDHRDDDRPRCGYCDAAIPVEADWYERGEKIVL